MDEDALFELVNRAVMEAKSLIETEGGFTPFALKLHDTGTIAHLERDANDDHDLEYETLVDLLKTQTVETDDIAALAIATRVRIPEAYTAQTESGIRIHLEERNKRGETLGARFLYVPYQLYKNSTTDEMTLHLYTPIPVAFPPEVFV